MVKTDVDEGSFHAMPVPIPTVERDRVRKSSERGVGSTRTSEESSAGTEFPRVSQELKYALASYQQTFAGSGYWSLRGNMLTGEIPEVIGLMQALDSLSWI